VVNSSCTLCSPAFAALRKFQTSQSFVSRRRFLKWILGSGAIEAVSLPSGGVYVIKV
jgi:hypothetical protein